MRVLRFTSETLAYYDPRTGVRTSGTRGHAIRVGPGESVFYFDPVESSADARVVLQGPAGFTAELTPGGMIPVGAMGQHGTWTLYNSVRPDPLGQSTAPRSLGAISIMVLSEKEALLRAGGGGLTPRREQRFFGAAEIGMNGLATNGNATSNAMDSSGMRDFSAFLDLTGWVSSSLIQLELEAGDGINWYKVQSESISSGAATLSDYTRRKAVTAAKSWVVNWPVNYPLVRLKMTPTGGDPSEALTVQVMMGA